MEEPAGARGRVLKLLASISCPACKNTILEPQKGVCGHDACASCWATNKRMCTKCRKHSGMKELRPNIKLATNAAVILEFVQSYKTYFRIEVELNESTNVREVHTPENSDECFIDRDLKYFNMNTYKKKVIASPVLLSISQNDSPLEFSGEIINKTVDRSESGICTDDRVNKVKGWLQNEENKFINVPKTSGRCISHGLKKNSKSIAEKNDTRSGDIIEKTDVIKTFFDNVLHDCPKQIKSKYPDKKEDIKIWRPVKNMKRVLKKPNIKKLDITIEPYNNSTNTNTELTSSCEFSPTQCIIDSVSLSQPMEVVVGSVDLSSTITSIPVVDILSLDTNPNQCDKDYLALQEVLHRSNVKDFQSVVPCTESQSNIPSIQNSEINDNIECEQKLKDTIKNLENSIEREKLKISKFSDSNKVPLSNREKNSSQVVSSILNDFKIEENSTDTDKNAIEELSIIGDTEEYKISSPVKNISKTQIPSGNRSSSSSIILNTKTKPTQKSVIVEHTESASPQISSVTNSKNVPFYYQIRLHKEKPKLSKTVPFYFKGNCSEKWHKAPTNGLDIRIKSQNTITSISVKNETCDRITETRDAQTSPIMIDYTQMNTYEINENIYVDINKSDNIPDNENKRGILSDTSNIQTFFKKSNKRLSNIDIKSTKRSFGKILFTDGDSQISLCPFPDDSIPGQKRSRQDLDGMNNESEIAETQMKKMKFVEPEIEIDNSIVVNFETQSPTQNENDNITTKPNNQDKLNVSENTNKLNLLKESVNLYQGGIDNDNFTEKSVLTRNIFESNSKTATQMKSIDKSNQEDVFLENEPCTPVDMMDSDKSIVEDTPQKQRSIRIIKKKNTSTSSTHLTPRSEKLISAPKVRSSPRSIIRTRSSHSDCDVLIQSDKAKQSPLSELNPPDKPSLSLVKTRSLDTPSSLKRFTNNVKHQSTPLNRSSKRSLTYGIKDDMSNIPETEEISCSSVVEEHSMNRTKDRLGSTSGNVKVLLEREFMVQAFEASSELNKSSKKDYPSSLPCTAETSQKSNKRVCLSCSCLSGGQKDYVKILAQNMNWDYTDNFTDNVSHLIVRVDGENKSQRSLKYVQALASGVWILNFNWIEACKKSKAHAKEDDYVALDNTGESGPYILKATGIKIFKNMSFYCVPPYLEVPEEELKWILTKAGGNVVLKLEEIVIKDPKKVQMLIAQPLDSQDTKYMDLCMECAVVPVNVEWALDCLGRGSCSSIQGWILANRGLLPKIDWNVNLISEETIESIDSN